MKQNYSELDITHILKDHLSRNGYRAYEEVSVGSQSCDIAATRGRWLTLIEVKKNDWQKAIKQCKTHELVADYITIAISLKSTPDNLIAQAKDHGYGIIRIDPELEECHYVLSPLHNRRVWPPERKRVAGHLRRLRHGS